MAIACVSVSVDRATLLRARPFRTAVGEPVAWLELGGRGELGVSGSPAAIRRLAAALLATAAAADELPARGQRPQG
jgi:hypothetical protein